jgi:hypothetical protein
MCCNYYIMNIGEIYLLLIILLLWLLSIYFFIKQFSKISTIERTFFANNISNESKQVSKDVTKSKSHELATTTTQISFKNKIECNSNPYEMRKYKIIQKDIRKSSSEPIVSFISNPYNLNRVKETSSFDHSIRQLSYLKNPTLAHNQSFFNSSRRDALNGITINEEMNNEDCFEDEMEDKLIDPIRIPILVKKHLIELHKKSQLNIAKKINNHNNDG